MIKITKELEKYKDQLAIFDGDNIAFKNISLLVKGGSEITNVTVSKVFLKRQNGKSTVDSYGKVEWSAK